MSHASTGVLRPITRTDLCTARAMALRCGAGDEADDVAQEVVIAIARYPRPLVVPPSLSPNKARKCVLWGFVRRQAARHRSQRARDGEPVRATTPGEVDGLRAQACGAAPSVEDRILAQSRVTLLRAAVELLRTAAPELHAVMQGELEGLSIARVASNLGIPFGTAYARSRSGHEAVRAQLRRWEADEARGAVRMQLDAMRGARRPWR